jgi:hypothetical protein
MADDDPKPEWDSLIESTDFLHVATFTRGSQTRTYRLRRLSKGAELWRLTESADKPAESIRECHFNDTQEATAFLQEVERTLRAGGWLVK